MSNHRQTDADKRPPGGKPANSLSKMTSIRPASLTDIPKIRELVNALKQHHVGAGHSIDVTLEQLQEYFKKKCFTGLMLINSPEKGKTENEVDKIGCMVLLPDVSPRLSSFGTDLDQFFIEAAYRNGGCGSKMLKKLCQDLVKANETHVKIVFQANLNLEPFYTRHGFMNITSNPPGIHLVKIDGYDEVKELMNRTGNGEQAGANEPVISAIPFTEIANLKQSLYPPWKRPIPSAFTTDAGGRPYPCPQIVTLSGLKEKTAKIPGNSASNSTSQATCMFTEQASIFAWFGVRLSFVDIVGDCRLITPRVIQERLKFWLANSARVDIFEIEVPFLTPEGEALTKSLAQIGMEDTAVKEGYNVAVLDSSGMKKLASCPT